MQFDELSLGLLTLLNSVIPPNSCAYVAGPLESGREFYEHSAKGISCAQLRPENTRRFNLFVKELRARLVYPVFDPSIFIVKGWTAAEHGEFFLRVVSSLAKEVWFLEGWEFSSGATKEFVLCCQLGISCRDATGNAISCERGAILIQQAADHVESLGLDASKLLSRISLLSQQGNP